jgi:ATP-dependent DNA helicase RecQ
MGGTNLQHENVYFESHLLESEEEKEFKLLELLKPRQGNTVVYCATSNAVDYVHAFLSAHGIESLRFHPRMRVAERRASIDKFNVGRSAVLVACGEIGGEIRAARVRLIVHFNYPVSMSDYIRETSPAGADGWPSRCALLYLRKDKRTQKRDPEELRKVVKYAQSAMCRTQLLARHEGGDAPECHRCDNCLKTPKSRPVEEKKRIDLDAIFEASL